MSSSIMRTLGIILVVAISVGSGTYAALYSSQITPLNSALSSQATTISNLNVQISSKTDTISKLVSEIASENATISALNARLSQNNSGHYLNFTVTNTNITKMSDGSFHIEIEIENTGTLIISNVTLSVFQAGNTTQVATAPPATFVFEPLPLATLHTASVNFTLSTLTSSVATISALGVEQPSAPTEYFGISMPLVENISSSR